MRGSCPQLRKPKLLSEILIYPLWTHCENISNPGKKFAKHGFNFWVQFSAVSKFVSILQSLKVCDKQGITSRHVALSESPCGQGVHGPRKLVQVTPREYFGYVKPDFLAEHDRDSWVHVVQLACSERNRLVVLFHLDARGHPQLLSLEFLDFVFLS